jgi:putative thioredoxin
MTTNHAHTPVRDVDDIDFAAAVIEASYDHPVVVDFWAPWCGPCRSLGPTLERLAGAAAGSWSLAKVNVDNNQQLSQRYRVQGIPAVKAFVDGKQVAEFTGAIPESQITAWLAGFVKPRRDDHTDALIAKAAVDPQGAEQGLAALIAQQPQNDVARFAYARVLMRRNDGAAAAVLQGVTGALADQARGLQTIAAALQEVHPADDPHAVRFRAALQAFLDDDVETALDGLLALVIGARSWNQDAARTTYLALLQALGPTHPLVGPARQRLASALF